MTLLGSNRPKVAELHARAWLDPIKFSLNEAKCLACRRGNGGLSGCRCAWAALETPFAEFDAPEARDVVNGPRRSTSTTP